MKCIIFSSLVALALATSLTGVGCSTSDVQRQIDDEFEKLRNIDQMLLKIPEPERLEVIKAINENVQDQVLSKNPDTESEEEELKMLRFSVGLAQTMAEEALKKHSSSRRKREARTKLNEVADTELMYYRSGFSSLIKSLNGIELSPDFQKKLMSGIKEIVAQVDKAQAINDKNGRGNAKDALYILTQVKKSTQKLVNEVKSNHSEYTNMVKQIEQLESLASHSTESRRKRDASPKSPADPWIEQVEDIISALEKSNEKDKAKDIKEAEYLLQRLETLRKRAGGDSPNPFQQWQITVQINSIRNLKEFIRTMNERLPKAAKAQAAQAEAEKSPLYEFKLRVAPMVGILMNIKNKEGTAAFNDVMAVVKSIDEAEKNPKPWILGQAKTSLTGRISALEKRTEAIVEAYKSQLQHMSSVVSHMV